MCKSKVVLVIEKKNRIRFKSRNDGKKGVGTRAALPGVRVAIVTVCDEAVHGVDAVHANRRLYAAVRGCEKRACKEELSFAKKEW